MISRPLMLWVRTPLRPSCLCPWARYVISIYFVGWGYKEGVDWRKYCNLSADRMCASPVVPLDEAKWPWRFFWHRNNDNRQQRFVSFSKWRYTNTDYTLKKPGSNMRRKGSLLIQKRYQIWAYPFRVKVIRKAGSKSLIRNGNKYFCQMILKWIKIMILNPIHL